MASCSSKVYLPTNSYIVRKPRNLPRESSKSVHVAACVDRLRHKYIGLRKLSRECATRVEEIFARKVVQPEFTNVHPEPDDSTFWYAGIDFM